MAQTVGSTHKPHIEAGLAIPYTTVDCSSKISIITFRWNGNVFLSSSVLVLHVHVGRVLLLAA